MLGKYARDSTRTQFPKFIATTVLLLALVALHGVLEKLQPETIGEMSSLNARGLFSSYHSNRKLLQHNFRMINSLQVNLSSPQVAHAKKNKECAEVRDIKSSANCCDFVKSTNSCLMDDGFIQYVQVPYCSFPTALSLAFVLLVLWLVFLFITLGLTADDYFCPSLTVISKTLRLSDNVAGVTFLALGNGAPDIFSALAALTQSTGNNTNGIQLGIQALFGAGMFVTTVVVGVISFVSTVTVASRPFIRDVLFYLGAVSWVFLTLYKENINVGEAIGFIAFYVAYILVVIVGHLIYQRWKRRLAVMGKLLESRRIERRMINSTKGSESIPLLISQNEVSGWRKFLQALKPIDREEWYRSTLPWKCFLIVKIPALFFLNLTIPVVDYDKENHNWNKWLTVVQCFTMPVFCVFATKVSNVLIGGQFPVWALALCAGLIFALIVAMGTRSDIRPKGHFLLAYLAFVVSVIWIYTTANEIVNLLQMFGIVFGLSNAILGLTLLAWGNSIGDLVSNSAMARQGFSPMAVSACFGGPMLNMLLGIGISCTIQTISGGSPLSLHQKYHQYQISAGFLAASLCSSAIIIPVIGFKVPRIYGVYLILLYICYLATSIWAEIKHV
ncbi:mitochondrial sodium/calcium exchanger protein-like isoform X2 [Montipora foliosa]|uniref:mitochondrial sodium/calcium exchanger protein-like isoform X2 n=1 Tax=Montipora foliosa TaxID=591990 RepID=UPI0035F2183C